jgi:hypothetical protein
MAIQKKLLLAIASTALTTLAIIPKAQAGTLVFQGVGADAAKALADMKTAIGGVDNLNAPPQTSGFRTIDWDAVRLDGTDVNPNTQVIDLNKTVAIPENRFQVRGAIFADPYAVSGDDFASVNPATTGEFPAFSPKNTFVMFDQESGKFDDRFIEQSITFPSTTNAAGTRGFGAIFKDVELAGSSSIEYFNGSKSLGKYSVPVGNSGDTEFLGVLFDDPIVTSVTLTVGTNALFSFDGNSFQSFGAENLQNGIDLAVTDDFVYAEPTTAKKVPESSTSLGLLFAGLIGAASVFKKKNKAKLA